MTSITLPATINIADVDFETEVHIMFVRTELGLQIVDIELSKNVPEFSKLELEAELETFTGGNNELSS